MRKPLRHWDVKKPGRRDGLEQSSGGPNTATRGETFNSRPPSVSPLRSAPGINQSAHGKIRIASYHSSSVSCCSSVLLPHSLSCSRVQTRADQGNEQRVVRRGGGRFHPIDTEGENICGDQAQSHVQSTTSTFPLPAGVC